MRSCRDPEKVISAASAAAAALQLLPQAAMQQLVCTYRNITITC